MLIIHTRFMSKMTHFQRKKWGIVVLATLWRKKTDPVSLILPQQDASMVILNKLAPQYSFLTSLKTSWQIWFYNYWSCQQPRSTPEVTKKITCHSTQNDKGWRGSGHKEASSQWRWCMNRSVSAASCCHSHPIVTHGYRPSADLRL